jgi:DNA-binding NtrC family response regulator
MVRAGCATLLSSFLVVDDDPKMRKMLTEVLTEEGYLVKTAANGKEAIKACQKMVFDVALFDVELPDIKGTELLKLKTIQPKMLTIIITGHPSIENASKAIQEKADGFIMKPFEIPTLLQMLKKLEDERTNSFFCMLGELQKIKEK